MNEYTRIFLHFLHALGETRRVSTFVFGTRLTNVTRQLRPRDPDDALASCSARRSIGPAARGSATPWRVQPRLVATRAGPGRGHPPFHRRAGARRSRAARGRDRSVAKVLSTADLGQSAVAVRRLRREAGGIRAMLPYVDAFRPFTIWLLADLFRALLGRRIVRRPRRSTVAVLSSRRSLAGG